MFIEVLPALQDNYIYLLHDPDADVTAAVDPGDAAVVADVLERRGWGLSHIFCTHHHPDHTDGVLALKARYGATVVGAKADAERIPGLDLGVSSGSEVPFGTLTAHVIETPGHTSGHIALWFLEADALFSGDTLFALGCGRLFEGTAAQLWASLVILRGLPDETRLYCGHEYTLSNARFALAVEPGNSALARRATSIAASRARGEATIPSTIGLERQTNPFLRADHPAIQDAVGMAGAPPAEVLAELRRRKNAQA